MVEKDQRTRRKKEEEPGEERGKILKIESGISTQWKGRERKKKEINIHITLPTLAPLASHVTCICRTKNSSINIFANVNGIFHFSVREYN